MENVSNAMILVKNVMEVTQINVMNAMKTER